MPIFTHKIFRDVMTLSELKQNVYLALELHGSEGRKIAKEMELVEAWLNVMQAVFLAIQASSFPEEDILLKGQQIFQTLFDRHFTKTLEVPCRSKGLMCVQYFLCTV